MKYKCIKTFYVEKVDDDGFFTGKYMTIPKDSIWELSETTFGISEIQLIRVWKTKKAKTWPYIEIGKERLNECFEQLKGQNNLFQNGNS